MSIQYVGCDFETTGTDPWGLAAPIQIGLALPSGYKRTELIGKWKWDEYEWNEVSESIHKIPQAEIDKARPAWQVDILLAADLLTQLKKADRMWTVAVGWNVGGFDRQFITRHFPALNKVLSYRCADLNSAIFALVGTSEKDYAKLKEEAKAFAASKLKEENLRLMIDVGPHDAGYDAREALWAFYYLSVVIKEPTPRSYEEFYS